MFKRIFGLTAILLLLIGAATLVWSQGECDFSYSNYARAVQLHDMGDYGRALRYYECARQEDPDSAIIPILIENVHEDIAEAGRAWSSDRDTSLMPVCSPELDHHVLGELAYNRGDSTRAMIHWQCILLQDPADERALHHLGRTFIDQGETRSAQHYFDRAEEARKAANESAISAQAAAQNGEPQTSSGFKMPDWLTPYETVPDSRNTAQVQPIVLFSERSRVLLQTEQLIVVEDDDSRTTWQLLTRLFVEQTKLTIATGEMTVTLYQRHAFALTRQASITVSLMDRSTDSRQQARQAFEAGDLESAIDWMLKVTGSESATVDDYAYLASLYSMHGDLAGAEASLLDALALDSRRLDIRCSLGRVYASLGDYAKAFAQFYSLISKDIGAICPKEDGPALNRNLHAVASVSPAPEAEASPAQETFERGMAMFNSRKLFAAANIFMEALAIDPAHLAARCQFGIVLTEWSNYGWALSNFEQVLAEDPHNACALQGRKVAILQMLAMYVPLTVDDFFYHARTFAQVEEWELARDAFMRGLELDPTRNDVRCELGMILAQLGDAQAALVQFDHLLAQSQVDSCAWSGRDALLQRLRNDS